MIQRGIDVNLPVSTRSGQIVNERVFVSVPLAYRQNHTVYLDAEPIRADLERVDTEFGRQIQSQVELIPKIVLAPLSLKHTGYGGDLPLIPAAKALQEIIEQP